VIKNNLFWLNTTSISSYGVDMTAQTVVNNWLQTSDPLFTNASATLGDPFNGTLPDLSLQNASPCINAGVALTNIASATGSGTSFVVRDASYFSDGLGVTQGDRIQLFGTAQTAIVVQVDYSTNTLTVNTPVSWSQNEGISLAYAGSAPDI